MPRSGKITCNRHRARTHDAPIYFGTNLIRAISRSRPAADRKARLSAFALVPKAKLVISFSQTAWVIPTAYSLRLPDYYYDWTRFLKVFLIDWLSSIYPSSCMTFRTRLLLRCLIPLAPMLIIIAGHAIAGIVVHSYRQEKGSLPWNKFLHGALPSLLFITFCLTPSTSANIFAAWSCERFQLDGYSNPPTSIRYLIGDLSVACEASSHEYSRITTLAGVFVGLCEP